MYIAPHFLGCVTAVTQAAVLLIPLENVHHPQLETTHVKKKKKRRMFSQLDESIGNPKKAAFKETEIFVGP